MAKQLGPKSILIRDAIKSHPDLGNTELAERLNNSPAREKDKLKVTAQDIATQKQALKKAGVASQPEEEDAAEPAATISKADAVRAALAEGIDTPEEGVAYILKKYGIEITKPQFSTYKSQERARQEKSGGGKPRRTPAAAPAVAIATPAVVHTRGVADSILVIKQLVERLGTDEVVKIAEIFRK